MKKSLLLLFALFLCSFPAIAQPGQLDLTFNAGGIGAYGGAPPPSGYSSAAQCIVYKSRIYQSGANANKIVIIGRFTSFNGVPSEYIARLNSDGSVDTSFVGPDFTSGYLYVAEILPDDKILVGGVFTVGGYSNFARLNPDGSLDTTFNPVASGQKGTNGEVHALLVQNDGRILVGGAFSSYNTTGKRMLRLMPDGLPDPTFNGSGTFNGEVRTIALQGSQILVGGFFSGFTGFTKAKIVRLTDNGSYDSTFNPGGTGATGGTAVFDIKVLDDKIFVAGKFDYYNGVNKRSIVRLNSDGTLDAAFNTGNIGVTSLESNTGVGSGYNVFSLCIQPDGKILLGGNFTQYNGVNVPKGMARIYQDGERDLTFVTGSGFTGGTLVYEGKSVARDLVLQSDGKIIVGGDFTQYNGINRRMLARILTRDCASSAQFSEESGWADDLLPMDAYTFTLISSGSYTIPSGTHLHACELEIKSGASLTVSANASITVEGKIVNNGTFIIEDSGSLVQVNDNAVNSDLGSSTFLMKRITKPVKRYDFTYWSSPVKTITANTVSPGTLSDKYFKFNTATNLWQVIPGGNEAMTPGRGYIIRAPQSFSTTVPAYYTAIFSGKPNNGIVNQPITVDGANKWNLLGNPYPSSIDALKFVSAPENAGLGGTVYLWTHFTPLTYDVPTGYYLYASADYATYNQTGYVAPTGYSEPFNGKIAAAQSFFIEGLVNASTATFKNSMRSADGNNQFLRLANATQSVQEKHRIWLNLTNSQGAFNQTLIGYLNGATNGVDRDFDGKTFSGNYVSLYSIGETDKFTIQGRALPFDPSDEIPLGYKATIAGEFSISIAAFDGLFTNQNVYLKDNLLNSIHDIKSAPYTFNSAIGEFNSRFVLVYQTQALGTPDAVISKLEVAVSDWVSIRSKDQQIQKVTVYDLAGRRIYDLKDIAAREVTLSGLQKNNAALLMHIILQDGSQSTQKVLF